MRGGRKSAPLRNGKRHQSAVADHPYVVVRHGRNRHFPDHSSAHGPPRGLGLATRREIHPANKWPILEDIRPAEQRRVRLPRRLLKRLLEQRVIQHRIRRMIQVEVEVEIQAKTQVPTQVTT